MIPAYNKTIPTIETETKPEDLSSVQSQLDNMRTQLAEVRQELSYLRRENSRVKSDLEILKQITRKQINRQ